MTEKTVSVAENELNTLRDTVDSLTARNNELTTEAAALKRELERMNEILLNAQRARFGQSSEKRNYVMPNQLGMFNEAEADRISRSRSPQRKPSRSKNTSARRSAP